MHDCTVKFWVYSIRVFTLFIPVHVRSYWAYRDSNQILLWSKHTVVCRVTQENGARANGMSILTGTTKFRFSWICSSVMAYPNGTKFTVELASMKGWPRLKFKKIPLAVPEIWVSEISLTGTTKFRFSWICSSVMAHPNGTKFTVELASMKGWPRLKFKKIPLAVPEIWVSKIA